MSFTDTPPTEMIRYECCECTMEATCVVTEATALAWLDHMQSHGPLGNYNAWSWVVEALRFSPDRPPLAVVGEAHA